MSVTLIKLKMNPVWKLNFFLFNIEGYGKFFSGITPRTVGHAGHLCGLSP